MRKSKRHKLEERAIEYLEEGKKDIVSKFEEDLIELILKSNDKNLKRLKKAYPRLVSILIKRRGK